MSTRLWITAFDLKKMKSWFGSKDADIKKRLVQEVTQQLAGSGDAIETFEKKQLRIDTINRITVVVDDGPPRADGQEFAADVTAAYALAREARISPQPWDDEQEEDEWSWMDLLDLSNQFATRFDARTQTFIQYFVEGRTFFYTRFAADCGWYSYLSATEAKQLTDSLIIAHKEASDLIDSGALNDIDFDSGLVDVIAYLLETLKKADGKDLFIYAA